MQIRTDHAAGGAIVAAGALVLALSADLPFGTLASPGAGMLPTAVTVLMMAFAVILVLRAAQSPPLADIDWSDVRHAARVVGVMGLAVAFYISLGFVPTMVLLLFVLTYAIERRPLLPAVLFSVGVTLIAYLLFNILLKAPLPRGVFWY
ncbi:MAG TPA: tripartite tricarboxylate transporter TctB family protein [Hyphomicrobiaceae bacterium]|nr:tripartite tricarboxylate transporter TctB family protein [Hyphomicrobiaceae bacterium]